MSLFQNKTALITGASSGIGEAFAVALAARGMHLILVARSEERLRQLAETLQNQHGVRVEVIVADLAVAEACAHIVAAVQTLDMSVDLLVNNAGFGTVGTFDTVDAARDHQQVMVNVAAVVDLTHAFLPPMVARGEGAILNVASLASFQPSPYNAVYGASKAFVLSFSLALWAEYRHTIRVLALCPGLVNTNFFAASGGPAPAQGFAMASPQQVVAVGLKALEQGKGYVVPGRQNALLAVVSKHLLSFTTTAKLTANIMRPRSAVKEAPSPVSD
jgi:short-subunit dehydrogenase